MWTILRSFDPKGDGYIPYNSQTIEKLRVAVGHANKTATRQLVYDFCAADFGEFRQHRSGKVLAYHSQENLLERKFGVSCDNRLLRTHIDLEQLTYTRQRSYWNKVLLNSLSKRDELRMSRDVQHKLTHRSKVTQRKYEKQQGIERKQNLIIEQPYDYRHKGLLEHLKVANPHTFIWYDGVNKLGYGQGRPFIARRTVDSIVLDRESVQVRKSKYVSGLVDTRRSQPTGYTKVFYNNLKASFKYHNKTNQLTLGKVADNIYLANIPDPLTTP